MATQAEARPPRVDPPAFAFDPCLLVRLDPAATQADLDLAYGRRGEELLDCDAKRAAFESALARERAQQDAWWEERERRRLPAWKRLLGLS